VSSVPTVSAWWTRGCFARLLPRPVTGPTCQRHCKRNCRSPFCSAGERRQFRGRETASISCLHRSETAAIWWRGRRFGLRGRWSAEREVVSGGGEGVGAIAQHRRRLCPRRCILHGEASSTAQHSPRRSIDDGIVHGAAQHRARRSIADGENLHGVFSG
jgi:hypothetical protein